ncbi:hypothetical protein [uncultured Clostridium sp.]|uniref:hypothetical protein n=1 Tax=uncultured Clostridium sp. TaxID=59620 RepID=UPI0025D3807E|nr:hypothetical protein [uncultured Clostridium sp.]
MIFTITSYNYLLGLKQNYRLKKDGSWQKIDDFHNYNENTDMIFYNHNDAVRWLKANDEQIINGIKCSTSPYGSFKLCDEKKYIFEILVHRKTRPHIFKRDELRKVLKDGDDKVNNALYVDFDGYLKLKNINRDKDFIAYHKYAVRNESFIALNGYVGREFDDEYIDTLYLNLLDEWESHLESGRSLYVDYDKGNLDEKTILININKSLLNLE